MLSNVAQMFIKEGDVVWDVGCNLGYFTVIAAHIVGRSGKILGIEPDIWLCNLLQKTIKENLDRDICILPMALSNEIGFLRFNIAKRSRSSNYLDNSEGSTQTGGIRASLYVPSITLDTLLNYHTGPNFIKIDIETAEHLALIGGEALFEVFRPITLIEVSSKNYNFVIDFYKGRNYRIYDAEKLPNLIEPIEITENILAVPN